MSRTLDLVCRDCARGIWVGQADYLYKEDANNIARFLLAHQFHRLEFGDSQALDARADYEREEITRALIAPSEPAG
jgi:hypothetical protein